MGKQELSKAALIRVSWAAIVFGMFVALLSALSALGPQSPGFGWRQMLGVIIGLFSVLFGYRWRRQAGNSG